MKELNACEGLTPSPVSDKKQKVGSLPVATINSNMNECLHSILLSLKANGVGFIALFLFAITVSHRDNGIDYSDRDQKI